jgi:hypothetical protein
MRILDIDVVNEEHSVERLLQKFDLVADRLDMVDKSQLGRSHYQAVSCQQQHEANIIWSIGFLE